MKNLLFITLSLICINLQAQVQLFGYKDYTMPYNINIGAGRTKLTHPSAYLELGDSTFSKKGLLPPRGWKDSIQTPLKGLQIFDVPTNQPWWYNGISWQQFGKVAVDSLYRANDSIYWNKGGIAYNLGTYLTKNTADLLYSALGHNHDERYIQNQYASAQNANAWISGRLRAGGKITADSSINISPLVTDPANPVDGDIWQNSTGAKIKARIGGVTYNLATENYARGSVLTGGTIYVDQKNPFATDTRVGLSQYSLTAPFKTVQAAINASTLTDVVYVRNGTYNENLTTTATNNNATTYIIDNATINGGNAITWQFSGNGYYENINYIYNIYLINGSVKNTSTTATKSSVIVIRDHTVLRILGNSAATCSISSTEGNTVTSYYPYGLNIRADRVTFSSTGGYGISLDGGAGSTFSFSNCTFTSKNSTGFFGRGGTLDFCTISGASGILLGTAVDPVITITNSTITATSGNAVSCTIPDYSTASEGFYYNNRIKSYNAAFNITGAGSIPAVRLTADRNRIDITNPAASVFNLSTAGDTANTYIKLTNNVSSAPMFSAAFRASVVYLKVKESNTNTGDSTVFFNINSGFGSSTPKSSVEIKGKTGYNQFRLQTQYTPTSSADVNGSTGDTAVDDNYFYYKTNAGWKRMPLSTFLLPFLFTPFSRKKTHKMKAKILAALTVCLLLFCSNLHAQLVPDSIASKQITLSFKGKYHGLLYKLMPNRGEAEAINYVNQVRKAVGNNDFDTAQVITVTVSYRLVANMFYNLGTQQERLTAADNEELKQILIVTLNTPQYIDLLQVIMAINESNKQQTEALRSEGIKDIMSIQLY